MTVHVVTTTAYRTDDGAEFPTREAAEARAAVLAAEARVAALLDRLNADFCGATNRAVAEFLVGAWPQLRRAVEGDAP